jgi:T4 RnlA family RNA ligase
MLLIQNKLRSLSGSWKDRISHVANEHGLDTSINEELGLCIFNYCQINSVKTDKLAQQCRGLILELDTWNIVARSFDRFFNLGECVELQKDFDWSNYFCNEKIDGSLMSLWNYNGTWFVSTRGSFADQKPNGASLTWAEMFWGAFGNKDVLKLLNSDYTYVFEFVSPYTKVVREYPNIDIVLLSVVDNKYGELSPVRVNFVSSQYGFKRPQVYTFKSPKEILDWLDCNGEFDPTFEGFVLRDASGLRIKVKSQKYVLLHRTRNNGQILLPKNLVPYILNNEIDELIVYFNDLIPIVENIKQKLEIELSELLSIYDRFKNLDSQKDFANSVKGFKFSSILFKARKTGEKIENIWKNSPDIIVKTLFS